jgi:hypothetical protein
MPSLYISIWAISSNVTEPDAPRVFLDGLNMIGLQANHQPPSQSKQS